MATRYYIANIATIVALLGFAVSAKAEVIVEYELRANGLATGSAPGGGIALADLGLGPDGGTFQLEIWSKVSNNTYNIGGNDYDLGLLLYAVDIYDSTGNSRGAGDALIPTEATVFGIGTGFWDSASTSPLSNYRGAIPESARYPEDVVDQSGSIPAPDWISSLTAVSANVWNKVGWGEYTWDGTDAVTLSVVGRLDATVVGKFPAGGTNYGHLLSEGGSIVNDAITFYQLPDPGNAIPEPSTLALLCIGAVGLLARSAVLPAAEAVDKYCVGRSPTFNFWNYELDSSNCKCVRPKKGPAPSRMDSAAAILACDDACPLFRIGR